MGSIVDSEGGGKSWRLVQSGSPFAFSFSPTSRGAEAECCCCQAAQHSGRPGLYCRAAGNKDTGVRDQKKSFHSISLGWDLPKEGEIVKFPLLS